MTVYTFCSFSDDEINNKAFPDDFLFGTSTASYQVEGKFFVLEKNCFYLFYQFSCAYGKKLYEV